MTIGIDGNEANVKEQVGVSTYTQNLLSELRKKSSKSLLFNVYLKQEPLHAMPEDNKFFKYRIVRGRFLWSQVFLPVKLLTGVKNDVFFSPAHYIPRFISTPTVVTIHDLSFHYFPEDFLKRDLFKLKNWTKYSVHKAKKIIAVSNTTKNDLVKIYKLPSEKIQVIYNGYEKEAGKTKVDQKLIKRLKNNFYILYVGTLQPRKNIPALIDAFYEFVKDNREFKLVIAGKKGWLYEKIFNKVRNLGLERNIIFAGYISNATLKELYKNAFCFVHPSLYEGFGIPILEAMSEGCPVISSDKSSLPEVGGNAALYFDPNDANQLVSQINNLKNHADLRNTLILNGKERVKLFSWQKCAAETLSLLRQIV